MGPKEDGILTGLSLELYSQTGKLYYVTAIGLNGAGVASDTESSRYGLIYKTVVL